MLISKQTLPRIFRIITQLTNLSQNILIYWNIITTHHNTTHHLLIKQTIKLVPSDLLQTQPTRTSRKQPPKNLLRKRRNILRQLIAQGQYLLIKQRSIRILSRK